MTPSAGEAASRRAAFTVYLEGFGITDSSVVPEFTYAALAKSEQRKVDAIDTALARALAAHHCECCGKVAQ